MHLPRTYLVDEHNHKIAVQLDLTVFEKIEEVLENYALVQLMTEEAEDETRFELEEARAYYQELPKSL